MGKFRRSPQANRGSEQLLYSVLRDSDWSETWFTLPDFKTVVAPPRWKMAIVVFIAAYAISSLSRSILNPFLGSWPLLANSIIYSAILVAGLTYFALLMLSKLLRRWLYPRRVRHLQQWIDMWLQAHTDNKYDILIVFIQLVTQMWRTTMDHVLNGVISLQVL